MIALIQRVTSASVTISGEVIGSIEQGLLVLLGVEKTDSKEQVEKMADKLLAYRIFSDQAGKMNLSLRDVAGGILLVPQFTLVADTARGLRPSFSRGAPAELGKALFEDLVNQVSNVNEQTACGVFGADMQVALVNDGPVTFWLQV